LLLAMAAVLGMQPAAHAQVNAARRVLILNDVGNVASPGIGAINDAIHTRLLASPHQIELYNESLETILFSDDASQRQIRDGYVRKYQERKPDVIVTVGMASLRFMVETHEQFFPDTPIVFCGTVEPMLEESTLEPHFTGTSGTLEPDKTLDLALRILPATRHVAVVGGSGAFDKEVVGSVRESFRKYESRVDFTYLTDLAMPTLLERLRQLPSNTVVIQTSFMQDASGRSFAHPSQGIPEIVSAANGPVFVLTDVLIGSGAVGGAVISWASQGRQAGDMVVRILNGELPRNIPIVNTANTVLFDWPALNRWGIRERDLPADSTLLNRQAGAWESYKWYIVGGLSLIVAEALLILEMSWLRRRQRKMSHALGISNDRFRMAFEGGGSVGWDWDIKSGRDRWFGDLQTMFGIPNDNHAGRVEDFHKRVHPEDRELVAKAVATARQERKPYAAEFRVVRADDSVRWVTAKGKFYYAENGEAERMLGIATDITERKQFEEALATMSRRVIEAHEEERAWIAREIHDDISQRFFLLVTSLKRLTSGNQVSIGALKDGIATATQEVSKLARDIQSLSRRLHSSTLDTLGLAAAAGSHCRDLASQHQVPVDIQIADIPNDLSHETSLTIFRVLQEALQNAIKHSRSPRFNVSLIGTANEIVLTVRDSGIGFDPTDVVKGRSLGLTTMQERVRLVAGKLSIDSKRGTGTTVRARVPLGLRTKSAGSGQ
jgi:PAS domain S-box-containing protein